MITSVYLFRALPTVTSHSQQATSLQSPAERFLIVLQTHESILSILLLATGADPSCVAASEFTSLLTRVA